ncbi:hypothetical protein CFK39_09990 [Brachybacterium avium]|uniref:Uncharacterized protein n=1 Tax=Brachybacterium avium TaxID=2017485 RepID=A0A220UDW4_9MICO|nr:hypothetical protein [Brachybacterium avium]ASK66092.1 hypothetical protein CFK39_09990 [Brachybacterium avium]
MAEHGDTPDFVPPTFSLALMGHLATGVVKAAAIALLLWVLGLTGVTKGVPAGTAIITAAVVMIAVAVVYWAALLTLERPWRDGDTRADIRAKYEQTKHMTREQFRPR